MLVIVPDPTPQQVDRMVARHRAQLTELLTRYGPIDMMCLDIFWGPKVWPQLRETILKMRELQPDVMLRARGIGNYGDYYTPEGFVPASKESTKMPWFVIYPLGSSFSYESDAAKYKGAGWIVRNLIDATAKGGNFMVGSRKAVARSLSRCTLKSAADVGPSMSLPPIPIRIQASASFDVARASANLRLADCVLAPAKERSRTSIPVCRAMFG